MHAEKVGWLCCCWTGEQNACFMLCVLFVTFYFSGKWFSFYHKLIQPIQQSRSRQRCYSLMVAALLSPDALGTNANLSGFRVAQLVQVMSQANIQITK